MLSTRAALSGQLECGPLRFSRPHNTTLIRASPSVNAGANIVWGTCTGKSVFMGFVVHNVPNVCRTCTDGVEKILVPEMPTSLSDFVDARWTRAADG
jgi:hypothetical protein